METNSRIAEEVKGLTQNILVLSAGGGGHVALPLLKQPESPMSPIFSADPSGTEEKDVNAMEQGDLAFLPYALSFMGEERNHPIRAQLLHVCKTASKTGRIPKGRFKAGNDAAPAAQNTHDQAKQMSVADRGKDMWRSVMQSSVAVLAPRGVGPTSFRLFEALQMGALPVYVWDEYAWLPYHDGGLAGLAYVDGVDSIPLPGLDVDPAEAQRNRHTHRAHTVNALWDEVGVVLHMSRFDEWLDNELPRLLTDRTHWRAKKTAIARYRRLFTYMGVVDQVFRFLWDMSSVQWEATASARAPEDDAPNRQSSFSLLQCAPKASLHLRHPPGNIITNLDGKEPA
jgi:hypothetical protein